MTRNHYQLACTYHDIQITTLLFVTDILDVKRNKYGLQVPNPNDCLRDGGDQLD